MEFDIKDVEKLPADGPHAKYRSAVIHAQKAIAAGKSSEEAHELYRKSWLVKQPAVAVIIKIS